MEQSSPKSENVASVEVVRDPTNDRTPSHPSQLGQCPPGPDRRMGGSARATSRHEKHDAGDVACLHESNAVPRTSFCFEPFRTEAFPRPR